MKNYLSHLFVGLICFFIGIAFMFALIKVDLVLCGCDDDYESGVQLEKSDQDIQMQGNVEI
jgi:hypothetical protein